MNKLVLGGNAAGAAEGPAEGRAPAGGGLQNPPLEFGVLSNQQFLLRSSAKQVVGSSQPTPQEMCACTLVSAVLESGASRKEAGVDPRKAEETDKKTKSRKAANADQASASGKGSASDRRQ